jgi:hypothetical protein
MNILIPLGAFLTAAIGPLATRVLAALGLGYVSYQAITIVVNQALGYAQSAFTALPSAIFNLLALAGVGQGFAILAAAISFRTAMVAQRKVIGVINK